MLPQERTIQVPIDNSAEQGQFHGDGDDAAE